MFKIYLIRQIFEIVVKLADEHPEALAEIGSQGIDFCNAWLNRAEKEDGEERAEQKERERREHEVRQRYGKEGRS